MRRASSGEGSGDLTVRRPRKRVDVRGHDRERRGRIEAVRPYSQMREGRGEEAPSLSALRRHPVPVEPHGAFEVALVDDAGNLRNNIYEIREVGTRKKIAMTGEEILNLPQAMGQDKFRAAYDEAMRDAEREDLGQLEGDQLIAWMGRHLPADTPTSEITRWLDEHEGEA